MAADLDRRAFLGGSLGVAAVAFLAACGANSGGDSNAGQQRRGGTLRVGALGQSSNLVTDPFGILGNDSDMMLMSLVYDPLTVPGRSPNVTPRLATQWSGDPSQRNWTFTIADGAQFHDGTPVTATDVAWSLRTLGAKTSWKVPVVLDSIKAVDTNRVTMSTEAANSQLPLLLRLMTFTVKAGTEDRSSFMGTGPFMLEKGSYRDGNAALVRNENWHGGDVLLDRIEITRFDTTDALSNAVLTGQIDLASSVGALAARTAQSRSNLRVIRRPNDLAMPIAIRTSDGPFTDPRVREAIRLGVDRQAMVEQVLSGYGTVGNDVLGTGDPTYDKSLAQRKRDLDRATALLAEAKFDRSQSYPLITKREVFNEVEGAQAFAAQMKDIGLTIDVQVKDAGEFYDKYWAQPAAPMSTVSWPTNDSVVFYASKVLNSSTPSNETAFKDVEFDRAYAASLAAGSGAPFESASRDIQQIQYDRGGYVLWGMADGVDIASAKVGGLPTLGGFGRVQLEKTWIAT